MGDVLSDLYNACDPILPATPEFYVDATAVRGGNAFTRSFLRELDRTDSYLRVLFSGHVGSGKSSELQHLRHKLELGEPAPDRKRCFPVLLDAGEYLDEYDTTPTDILLAIVAELAATLKEKRGIELQDNYFVRRLNEIKQLCLTDLEVSRGELPLSGAKVEIKLLKGAPGARERVRERLLPQMTTILTEINTVFDEARLKLKQRLAQEGARHDIDIVLILDNLEKIERIAGQEEGEASHRALFIERAPQLTNLNVHVVYTVPLVLVRACGPQLERVYGSAPFVLPMIKVEERGSHVPYTPGRICLRTILERRAGETPLAEIFEEEALDWLLTYSGGDVRELMSFVRRACNEVDTAPITLKAAQRALRPTIALYGTSIRAPEWSKLAQLELSPDQQIDNSDLHYQRMLRELIVMEYMDSDSEEDPFNPAVPWYAVNPIVRQLSPFKAAVEALRSRAR
jgi:hypothetical protein